MATGVVLIKAPPQSGKTSLLQLVALQKDWLQGLACNKDIDIDICFVSMLSCKTLDQALALKRPGCTWRDLLAESPAPSTAGGKMAWFDERRYLMSMKYIRLFSCRWRPVLMPEGDNPPDRRKPETVQIK